MSLQIGSALSSAVETLTTAAAAQLAALYVVFGLVSTLGINTALVKLFGGPDAQVGITLPVAGAVGLGLYVAGLLATVALTVVVLRTVAHDAADLGSIPDGVTDRLGITALFLLVANLVVGVAVLVGFVLLIVPGVFLAVSLLFTQVFVAVEGEGPFEAMGSSWALASGHRLRLFGLGLVVVAISFLVGAVGSIVSVVAPAVGTVAQVLLSAPLFVFTNAVLVDAFQQLEAVEAETVGAMTAEDLEEGGMNQNR